MHETSNSASVLSLANVQTMLHGTEKDDIAFLMMLVFSSVVYMLCFKEQADKYRHVWYEKPQADDENKTVADTRDIALKLERDSKDLVIFWGSQSGTAQGFANRLVRDCRSRFKLGAVAVDLSDYDPESITRIPKTKLAIFIVSTYGEGDPSDNASQFLAWLRTNAAVRFPNLQYAAFGLGNTKYKFYNRVIDIVTEALDRFGAEALMKTGKADDAHGATEEDFTAWKESLFAHFRDNLLLQEQPRHYEPSLDIVEDPSLDIIDLHVGTPVAPRPSKRGVSNVSPIHALSVKSVEKLFNTTDRNCLHLELDMSSFSELKYKTGDHLAVWPNNPSSEVERLINVLGLKNKKDTPLLIKSLDPSVYVKVPSPTNWEALFQCYLEICAPIPRETVIDLGHFAPSESTRDLLKQMSQSKESYHNYCTKTHVTLGRLLESVLQPGDSWSGLPLSFVLERLPCLSPRYYSISSSSIVAPKQISITVATTSSYSHGIHIPGLTTSYLLDVEKNQNSQAHGSSHVLSTPNETQDMMKVFAHVRKSKFRLPVATLTPIIMIAAGSGIAPFRGFLYERARLAKMGRDVGQSKLFFGCRSPTSDFLYQSELQSLKDSSDKIEIITAFSRVDNSRQYVQDRLEEKGEQVIKLLMDDNAYIYICGSATMARDVTERLCSCMQKRLGWNDLEQRGWFEMMRKTHKWQEDVWG